MVLVKAVERAHIIAAAAVLAANLCIACFAIWSTNWHAQSSNVHTSIEGTDSSRWELPGFDGPVEMTFYESRVYAIDGPNAEDLWTSNRRMTTHHGYVQLGPDHRLFAVAMFHQLHCLNMFRLALTHPQDGFTDHVQHCLSYLRQAFLCAADDTLEPGDFQADYRHVSVSHTRTCRDWSAVYYAADAGWNEWAFSR